MTDLFVSYSQHGEDVVLWRALGGEGAAFYVDVGAFDPTEDSVTRALYERGWRGVNIEPQPSRIALFQRERPEDVNLGVAIGAENHEATLYIPGAEPWATLNGRIAGGLLDAGPDIETVAVDVRTLDSVFAEHDITAVDVLKVDVEGGEPEVIAGLDLGRVRPRIVVVEGVAPVVGVAAGDEAVRMLVGAGYTHCMFDGLNHYLTCEAGLVESLSVPANPVDGYVRATVLRFEAAIAGYESQIDELRDANVRLNTVVMAQEAEAKIVASAAVQVVEPETRAARKRSTFADHLSSAPPMDTLTEMPSSTDVAAARVADALREASPADVVTGLYRAVLGRPPDPDGLRSWAEALAGGADPLLLAETLCGSEEALALSAGRRRGVAREIVSLRARRALEELGDPSTLPGDPFTSGQVEQEILVRAVYRVCLARSPSADELAAEVANLRAGVGRELYIRAFAHRPGTWQTLFGTYRGGLRARMWDVLGRRNVVSIVRERVHAIEQQQVGALVAIASESGPPIIVPAQPQHGGDLT